MDSLLQLRAFVSVADAGAFTRGAAILRISPAAATRAVQALEARVGARLLERTTRRIALTEAGARFLGAARQALEILEAAERDAAGESVSPKGALRVTAPVGLGRVALAPVLRAFLSEHTEVAARLTLLDRPVNLIEEGLDAALRVGPLAELDLAAVSVGRIGRALAASPDYLSSHAAPESLEALREHSLIGFEGLAAAGGWRLEGGTLAISPRFEVNDAQAAIDAALGGDGIVLAQSYALAAPVSAGALVPVAPHLWPAPAAARLIRPDAGSAPPPAKTRAFFTWAAPRLRARLSELTAWWEAARSEAGS